MVHISYIGKNGGQNGELEAAKTEALQIQNELNRVKLQKLRGTLVEHKEVEYVVAHALTVLREEIMRLPNLVSAELRGIDASMAFGIRTRVDARVRRALEELAGTLCRAVEVKDFFAELDADDETEEQKDAREQKRDLANRKRREKRAAKSLRPRNRNDQL